MKRNGFDAARNPILKPLETIECRDALLNPDGTEAEWAKADVIVGNPPFLGTKLMYGVLGVEYTQTMRRMYRGRVSPFSDLVCWWFAKAQSALEADKAKRVGL